MAASRNCPYCAEEISEDAVRCRFCRSRLTTLDPESWHRNHPERRIGGVASAVAEGLALPLSLVRLGFLILTFVHFLGPILYAALWLVIPFEPGEPSPLASALDRAKETVDFIFHDRDDGPGERPRGHDRNGSSVREDLLS
ncbi:MAG: PspC domain-containing protein [Candidatus Binatia bacterium]